MGLFLWWASLPLPCFSSVVYPGRPPRSQRKGDRKNLKQAVSQLCTPRLPEKTRPWDAVGPLEFVKCRSLSWVTDPLGSRCASGGGSAQDVLEIAPVVERVHRSPGQALVSTCERRGGRKEDWVRGASDSGAALRKSG